MRIFILTLLLSAATGCNYLWKKRFGGNNALAPDVTGDSPRLADGELRSRPINEDEVDLSKDISLYAEYCKQELGLPPEPLAPWNCLDGREVPITVEGKPIDPTSHAAVIKGDAGCDRPAWLGDKPCATYTFVQRRDLAPNVIAFLLCRKREYSSSSSVAQRSEAYLASGSLRDFMQLFDFDSVGLIWANMETGKTCFFDYVGKTYGGYVASPDDSRRPELHDLPDPKPPARLPPDSPMSRLWRKNGKESWKQPRESASSDFCTRCHDAMPFQSSPYMQQVFEIPILPSHVPYSVVGKVYDRWRLTRPLMAISTTPIQGESQVCTRCHRIGSQETCKTFLDYATARRAPASTSILGQTFRYQIWMPPMPAAWADQGESEVKRLWHEAYDVHVTKLACCCKNPSAIGCTRQALDSTPLADPIVGTGPERCE